MHPYQNEGLNTIYDLLFCDNIQLFSTTNTAQNVHPWNILLSAKPDNDALQQIVDDNSLETRLKILAWHLLKTNGAKFSRKELLGVIVEVGLQEGLDVVAAYKDGTARYINYSGAMIVWENQTEKSNELVSNLFAVSENVVKQIGPWDKERRPPPVNDMVRLSFLVSDGLYFGEGPFSVLQKDAMGGPVIYYAGQLMSFLMEQSQKK